MNNLREIDSNIKQTLILRDGYVHKKKGSVSVFIVLKAINYVPGRHYFYKEEISDIETQKISVIILYQDNQKIKKDRVTADNRVLCLEREVKNKKAFYNIIKSQNFCPEKNKYVYDDLDFLNDLDIRLEITYFQGEE